VFDRITDDIQPLGDVVKTRLDQQAITRLVSRGIVQVSGLTPSDASHVLGTLSDWDSDAAAKAMMLFGRRRTGAGDMLANDPEKMAQIIVDQLTHQTALALLETAFAEDGAFDAAPDVLARSTLMQLGLRQHRGLVKLDTGINVPVVGLGASAPNYYPAVGELVNCDMILPEHAGVANAIGAVVGRIVIRQSGQITAPSEGKFRVHLPTGPQDFGNFDAAYDCLVTHLKTVTLDHATSAGAQDIQTDITQDIRQAAVEAREIFVEATITVQASGRARIAT